MTIFKTFSVLLLVSVISNFAWADGYFRLGGLYQSSTSGTTDANGTMTRTLMMAGGGYLYPSGWTLGLLYQQDSASSGGQGVAAKGIAANFGWITKKEMGPYILANYFPSISRDQGLTSGNGYQIELGYKIQMRSFAFGPQLLYRDFIYEAATSDTAKEVSKGIDPAFVFWFFF